MVKLTNPFSSKPKTEHGAVVDTKNPPPITKRCKWCPRPVSHPTAEDCKDCGAIRREQSSQELTDVTDLVEEETRAEEKAAKKKRK